MYMRITWGKVRPGLWETFAQTYERVADPNIVGLQSRWLVRDSADQDAFFAVTLWNDLDAIKTWEASAVYRSAFLDELDKFMLGAYSVSLCKVAYASVGSEIVVRTAGTPGR